MFGSLCTSLDFYLTYRLYLLHSKSLIILNNVLYIDYHIDYSDQLEVGNLTLKELIRMDFNSKLMRKHHLKSLLFFSDVQCK